MPYIVYGHLEFYRFAQIPNPLVAVLSLGPHLSPSSLVSLVIPGILFFDVPVIGM